MRPFVELDGVGVSYGEVRVLDGINLTVEPGDFLGIIGPNGSGKTTLLRVMLGLLEPQEGSVRLFGQPPAAFREWRRLGYVPQRAALRLPDLLPDVVGLEEVPAVEQVDALVEERFRVHQVLRQRSQTRAMFLGSNTPLSVMNAVTNCAGVRSKYTSPPTSVVGSGGAKVCAVRNESIFRVSHAL